jgi:hypothetical protein
LIGLGGQKLRMLRAPMQMVFQDPYASLNPKMRVAEILEEGMAAMGSLPSSFNSLGAGQASSSGNGSQLGSSTSRQAHIDLLLDQVGLVRQSKWRCPCAGSVATTVDLRRADQCAGCFCAGANTEFVKNAATGIESELFIYHPQPCRG